VAREGRSRAHASPILAERGEATLHSAPLTRADLRPGPLVPARAQRGILGSRVAPAAGLLLLSLGACTAYKSLVGENTVSLQGAEVTSMQVDIRVVL
jgi:hypothetical protein